MWEAKHCSRNYAFDPHRNSKRSLLFLCPATERSAFLSRATQHARGGPGLYPQQLSSAGHASNQEPRATSIVSSIVWMSSWITTESWSCLSYTHLFFFFFAFNLFSWYCHIPLYCFPEIWRLSWSHVLRWLIPLCFHVVGRRVGTTF